MERGKVVRIGEWREFHGEPRLTGFIIEGGDYPGIEAKRGKLHRVCGWSVIQLYSMVRTGRVPS